LTNKRTRLSAAIPVAARRRFETHPATQGAGRAEYFALVEDVFAALQPQDVIEFILIKPIVDNTWQIESLRGVEVALLSSHALDVVVEAYNPEHEERRAEIMADLERWNDSPGDMSEEEAARRNKEVEELLEAGRRRMRLAAAERERKRRLIPPHAVPMRAFLQHSGNLERIGRMLAQAEARIRTALRELERYRADRRPSTDWAGPIVDAEFSETQVSEENHDVPAAAGNQPAQRTREQRTAHGRRQGALEQKRAAARARRPG
jgi:hypothetical protein